VPPRQQITPSVTKMAKASPKVTTISTTSGQPKSSPIIATVVQITHAPPPLTPSTPPTPSTSTTTTTTTTTTPQTTATTSSPSTQIIVQRASETVVEHTSSSLQHFLGQLPMAEVSTFLRPFDDQLSLTPEIHSLKMTNLGHDWFGACYLNNICGFMRLPNAAQLARMPDYWTVVQVRPIPIFFF